MSKKKTQMQNISTENRKGDSKRAPGDSKRAPGDSKRAPGDAGSAPGDAGSAPGVDSRGRAELEALLDTVDLAKYFPTDIVGEIDPGVPLAEIAVTLSELDEKVVLTPDALTMESLWSAARTHEIAISSAVSHVLSDSVRSRALSHLLNSWNSLPAADRQRASLLLRTLPDPDTPGLFLGALHPALLAALARAAGIRREREMAEETGVTGMARTQPAETEGDAAPNGDAGPSSDAGPKTDPTIPDRADTPADCETLCRALEWCDTGTAFQIIARLSSPHEQADAVAWLTSLSERDYRPTRAMIYRLRALLRLDVGRAVQLASGLFRNTDSTGERESGESSGQTSSDEELVNRLEELLDLLLESDAPEVYPLLVFIFEPKGQLSLPRDHGGRLRERIKASPRYRFVRRLLRRLQHGEPVLVPSGVDFERFVDSELRRLGHSSGSPDPQVIVDIRRRWQEAMHEALLYLRPADIPEVSFDGILGAPQAGESVGDHVEAQSENDPEWILKPAAEGKPPRIVATYDLQATAYAEAGLSRLHEQQRRSTLRDLVVRGARALTDGESERAKLYADAALGLDSSDPFAKVLRASCGAGKGGVSGE